jgi:SIR2-like domain
MSRGTWMTKPAATQLAYGASEVDPDHIRRIVRKMLRGIVVPLLGAGVNLATRLEPEKMPYNGPEDPYLPSGRELARFLARAFECPKAVGNSEDLLRISQYVDVMEGSGELYERLHEVFSATYEPGPVHRFFAHLQRTLREAGRGPQVILTTNYDDALERAFDAAGEEYDLLTYVWTNPAERRGGFVHRVPGEADSVEIEKPNEYTDLDLKRRPVIVKMHGAVVRCETFKKDSYVITEDHYIDYLAQADLMQLLPASIAEKLRNSHFLFLGYGMADWNMRVILRRIWGSQGLDFPSWSIQWRPDPLETRFWDDRGVDVFDIDVGEYVKRLRVELVRRRGLPFGLD